MPKSIGLFAGIGGIEEGLRRAGWDTQLMAEIDPVASSVLRRHFPESRIVGDIRQLRQIPKVVLLTAGFPCQNLSQAGQTEGINGAESRLVREVFRLLANSKTAPSWVLLENVPFMLKLDGGQAMRFVTKQLEELGYTWAYRVVDTRSFGLPQRRRRVLILASRVDDPRSVLFSDDAGELSHAKRGSPPCGFYWTEGNTGLGWAVDAVPALKTGSRISIPSPPAIWFPKKRFLGLPDIKDAERLQGFPEDWTRANGELTDKTNRQRWRLVGNAVSVPVSTWIGRRLLKHADHDPERDIRQSADAPWANAGWGRRGMRYATDISEWPVHWRYRSLRDFLRYEPRPLSARATEGFFNRAKASSLRIDNEFLDDVVHHLARMKRMTA